MLTSLLVNTVPLHKQAVCYLVRPSMHFLFTFYDNPIRLRCIFCGDSVTVMCQMCYFRTDVLALYGAGNFKLT